jgi:NADPH:quinone reductase-like Zn-dependent oxidoreductase
MKLRYKVLGGVAVILVGAIAALGLVLSHDSPCQAAPPLAANTPSMKAIVYRCYGNSNVLKLEEVAKPAAADDRVLVKVQAASVNPLDWHYMQGKPYVMRAAVGVGKPGSILMGADFAGTVESVGKNVTRFKPGDEVFGDRDGAFGEYVSARENGAIASKPSNMSM